LKLVFFLSLCLLLVGCSSTSEPVSFKNSRIGVDYKLNETLKLCHTHLGKTVFQNTEEIYPITENVNALVTKGYVEGIKNTFNTPVQIDSSIDWSNYLSYSSWDASAKLMPQGLNKLREIQAKYDLDFLLVARDYENFYKGEACNGAWFKTQMSDVRSFVPIYVALVFDANSGKYIGSTFITNDHHSSVYQNFNDVSKLEHSEVLKLIYYSEDAATKAASMFFE